MQALQIINKTMRQITEAYPQLYSAVKLLKPTEYPQIWKEKDTKEAQLKRISTDGLHLWYTPEHVEFVNAMHGVPGIREEIMHVIMHCILGHLEDSARYKDKKVLWAVMDRQVWNLNERLDSAFMDRLDPSYRYVQLNMNEYLGDCFDLGCYYIAKDNPVNKKKLIKDAKKLILDDHRLWNQNTMMENEKISSNVQESLKEQKELDEVRKAWKSVREILIGEGPAEESLIKTMKSSQDRKRGYGSESGDAEMLVTAEPENQNTYAHVLTRFLKMKEVQKETPDTIDWMLYQYGLDLHGNVPLMEPLESEDQLKLNTICVAVDTSGSCEEDAGRFFRETQNILSDISRLSPQCEFYFFQCDTSINKEECYMGVDDIPWRDLEELRMYGWGGTSFVPVFNRIMELKEKEEKIIDCLIYFSDAMGEFPEDQPDYPVFFILPQEIDEEYMYDGIPEWIEIISLKEGCS